eukprot:4040441-Pyramimonas_sp.AAC.1
MKAAVHPWGRSHSCSSYHGFPEWVGPSAPLAVEGSLRRHLLPGSRRGPTRESPLLFGGGPGL